MKLEEVAQTMRCQTYRKLAKATDRTLYLEMTPEDFKTVSDLVHFAPKEPKNRIWVDLNSRSEKFLLQRNDILIRIFGGLESIGTTCFVATDVERFIIPSKSLLIVRPNMDKIDPVWLYYRLSQGDIKKQLQENALGTRPRYILKDDVGTIEFAKPGGLAITAAHAAHKFFLENLWALEKKQEEEREEWKDLANALRG